MLPDHSETLVTKFIRQGGTPKVFTDGIFPTSQHTHTYLIFVILFTQARFLENKIYTKERINYDKWILRQNHVNHDLLGQANDKDQDHTKVCHTLCVIYTTCVIIHTVLMLHKIGPINLNLRYFVAKSVCHNLRVLWCKFYSPKILSV